MLASSRTAANPNSEARQALLEVVVIGCVAVLVAITVTRSYDIAGGLLVTALLFPPTLMLLRSAWKSETDPVVRRLIVAGAAMKLVGIVARYGVAFSLYGGTADANVYHQFGTTIGQTIRAGRFSELDLGNVLGTNAIKLITGIVYAGTGSTKLGGFVMFAWFGFIGSYLCYRAFRLALPDGNVRRYAALTFLLPSIVFWPSSIGKESIMMLGIGVSLLGVARLLTRTPRALPILALGLALTGLVRPHITFLLMIATIGAYFRADPSPDAPRRPLFARVLVFAFLLVLSASALAAVGARFNIDPGDTSALTGVLDRAGRQTDEGGSQFRPSSVRNPLSLIPGAFGVLYRPTILEATKPQVAAVAAECTLLLALTITAFRKRGAVRTMLARGLRAGSRWSTSACSSSRSRASATSGCWRGSGYRCSRCSSCSCACPPARSSLRRKPSQSPSSTSNEAEVTTGASRTIALGARTSSGPDTSNLATGCHGSTSCRPLNTPTHT